jgi:hypothetical protein
VVFRVGLADAPESVAFELSELDQEKGQTMLEYWIHISPLGTFLATIAWFTIAMPTAIAAYYQSWKTRQEARAEREGTLHSANCLEFVAGDGSCINLAPLDTLHSMPKVGDVALLPGHEAGEDGEFVPGAYLVASIEHIYTRAEYKGSRPQEARLTKAVAQVTSLNP